MFIVIDTFSEPIVVVDPVDGLVKQFETYAEAQVEANECQEAIVVPLDGFDEGIKLLSEASATIDVLRFEEGEDMDEYDLEGNINKFLTKYNPGSLTQEGIKKELTK